MHDASTTPGQAPQDPVSATSPSIADPYSESTKQGMFASLQHRNYRIFFFAQIVSLTGTWMQMVAEGWLVYSLTRSPMSLGLVRFLHTLPVTLLTFLGGAMADRYNKRAILVVTQCLACLFSILLYALSVSEQIAFWQIGLLAVCLGVSNAIDIPVRQSFVVDMVGKRHLPNAIALNSSVFNAARIVGPAVAGLLVSYVSLPICFLINALSYLAVIVGYMVMKLPDNHSAQNKKDGDSSLSLAVRWIWDHEQVRPIFILVSTVSLCCMSYLVLMPVFVQERLHVGADGLGWLLTANGVGAISGSITLAWMQERGDRQQLSHLGLAVFLLASLCFAWTTQPIGAGVLLAVSGWGMIVFFATSNTMVQGWVADGMRGRVMGAYAFCFIGLSPFGHFLAGWLAKVMGAPFAVSLGSAVGLVALCLGRTGRIKSSRCAPIDR
jgi:MFS family permease